MRERLEDWKKDLTTAANLPVKHISCYGLDCKRIEQDEDEAAGMYEYAIGWLGKKDFKQYEISNFAKEGFCCRHNLNYWEGGPYIGLGPGAVSYIDGIREENISDIADYIIRARSGIRVVLSGENLEKEARAREAAAVKIRTMEGINFKWFEKRTGFDFADLERNALPKLLEERLIEYIRDENGIAGTRLTGKGILLCDIVSGAFL